MEINLPRFDERRQLGTMQEGWSREHGDGGDTPYLRDVRLLSSRRRKVTDNSGTSVPPDSVWVTVQTL